MTVPIVTIPAAAIVATATIPAATVVATTTAAVAVTAVWINVTISVQWSRGAVSIETKRKKCRYFLWTEIKRKQITNKRVHILLPQGHQNSFLFIKCAEDDDKCFSFRFKVSYCRLKWDDSSLTLSLLATISSPKVSRERETVAMLKTFSFMI